MNRIVFGCPYDQTILKECRGYLKTLAHWDISLKDKCVLDLGAHRGFFTNLAFQEGAKEIVAVEPAPSNLKFLRKNGAGATILQGAVIGWEDRSIPLMASKNMRQESQYHVVRHTYAQKEVGTVPAYHLSELLKKLKAKSRSVIVKMDIQGAEWSIWGKEIIPSSIAVMFGEIHYYGRFKLEDNIRSPKPLLDKKWTDSVLNKLTTQGFKLYFRRGQDWEATPPFHKPKYWLQDFIFIRRSK